MVIEALTGLGGRGTAGVALQQLDPELVLQCLEAPGKSGLADEDVFSGFGQVASLEDSDKMS